MAQCANCGKKGLFLKTDFQGLCESCQKAQLTHLQNAFLPEQQDIVELQGELEQLSAQYMDISNRVEWAHSRLRSIDEEVRAKESLLYDLDDSIDMQSFGLYRPHFAFEHAEEYKIQLDQIRDREKEMIRAGAAVNGNMRWTVDGNAARGKKMVCDMQKLLLRAFNSECDMLVDKVKYNNIATAEKRLDASAEAISKLGAVMNIYIDYRYLQLKKQELHLAFEYQQKKQEEKEEQKETRARMREEAKLAREIEEARRKTEKEMLHYQNALIRIERQISKAIPAELASLEEKKAEILSHISDTEKAIRDIDYREANQRAGYVYIISNIGSFGKDIYKIGMTRRLDPTERVSELSDASVPFNFDIHAMIFSDDAPALEAALHRAFETRKINMVNTRREFFNVTLDEIKAVVKANYDKTVEFIEFPGAEQYYVSEKMREALVNRTPDSTSITDEEAEDE